MPWENTVDQRICAAMDIADNGFLKVSACADVGISRPALEREILGAIFASA